MGLMREGALGSAAIMAHCARDSCRGRLAVVDLGRCAHAVGAVAKENLVHVELEYLVLLQFALDTQGQEDFLDFPGKRFFRRQKEVARQLLGDRAAADGLFPGRQQ